MKKLYKSKNNRIFAGVIGGIGEYLDVDPVALRVLWLVLLVFTGFLPAFIVYLLACLVVPGRPDNQEK